MNKLTGTNMDTVLVDEAQEPETIPELMDKYGLTAEEAQNVLGYANMIKMRDAIGSASKYAGGKMVSPKLVHRTQERLVERAQIREAGIRKMLRLLNRATGGEVKSDNAAALRLMEQKGL